MRFPVARLDSVVADWENYKKTNDYQKQKDRSAKLTEGRLAVKIKRHYLKDRRRRARSGLGPQAWIDYFHSGDLDDEIALLEPERLPCFEDYIACKD